MVEPYSGHASALPQHMASTLACASFTAAVLSPFHGECFPARAPAPIRSILVNVEPATCAGATSSLLNGHACECLARTVTRTLAANTFAAPSSPPTGTAHARFDDMVRRHDTTVAEPQCRHAKLPCPYVLPSASKPVGLHQPNVRHRFATPLASRMCQPARRTYFIIVY